MTQNEKLSKKYPGIKTFKGKSKVRKDVEVRLSTQQAGINAWIHFENGPDLFLQPVKGNKNLHFSYLKIKNHNSNRSIQGCNQRILREKLYRVLGSRSWNHVLNGELCSEHFQKGPWNFVFFFLLVGKPLLPGCRCGPALPIQSGPALFPPIRSGLGMRSLIFPPPLFFHLSFF